MRKYHSPTAKRVASVKARKRARSRWDREDALRAVMARIDPVRIGGIVRRIVVIDGETTVREIVFYSHDRYCDRRRKLREMRALADL